MENPQAALIDEEGLARLRAIEAKMIRQAKLKAERDRRYRAAHPEFRAHLKAYKQAYYQNSKKEKAAEGVSVAAI